MSKEVTCSSEWIGHLTSKSWTIRTPQLQQLPVNKTKGQKLQPDNARRAPHSTRSLYSLLARAQDLSSFKRESGKIQITPTWGLSNLVVWNLWICFPFWELPGVLVFRKSNGSCVLFPLLDLHSLKDSISHNLMSSSASIFQISQQGIKTLSHRGETTVFSKWPAQVSTRCSQNEKFS